MADSNLTNLTSASPLSGTETTYIVQGGNSRKTTVQDVSNLATKTSVGLGNVDNTSDENKPISTATQTALDAKQATLVSGANIKTINSQPITGSGNLTVDGTTNLSTTASATNIIVNSSTGTGATITLADATNAGLFSPSDKTKFDGIATGATANSTDAQLRDRNTHTGTQLASTISDFASTVLATVLTGLSTATNAVITSADSVLSALEKLQAQITGLGTSKENTITAGTTAQYFRGDKTFQTLDKTAVGLSNVDNTSDENKPISTATQTALNAKENTLNSDQKRKVTISTLSPTGGSDGDIWLQYTP